MFGKKISLRLHIFAAFCLVFLLAFSTVFIAFRLVIQNYVDSDSKEKLELTSDHTLELAGKLGFQSLFRPPSEKTAIIKTLIQTVSGSSDVKIAFLNKSLYIEYPMTSDSYQERIRAASIKASLIAEDSNWNDREVRKVTFESASYYTLAVPYNRVFFSEDLRTPDSYLLFYIDSSPYVRFAQSLDRTLYFILISALLMAMLASLLVSNSIIRSLHKLTAFASRIGAGDFRSLKRNFLDKELDSLAADMNLMAFRLSKADTEQKTFFQNASHELRTPLMSIQGYAEGIKYKVFDDPGEATDIIISESKRLSDMVENLLTISRLDLSISGSSSSVKAPFDLRELIESVIENTRGSVMLSKKSLVHTFPDEPVTVYGNEKDLFRAFENLLSNALRYAENHISLTLEASEKTANIRIIDDGEGIPEDLLPDIFNRFVRGEKGKHGIGLALVKAITEDHGGSVSAHNRSDGTVGAVFEITLPIPESN